MTVPAGRSSRSVARGFLLACLILGAVVTAVVLAGGGGRSGHHLFVTVPDATNVFAGQDVRAAGQNVGTIASTQPIQGGRATRLELQIDDAAWPLPRSTKFALRGGGTISYSNRYIEVARAATGGPALGDGDTIPTTDFTVPVEFDQLLGTFTPKVRGDLSALLGRGGVTFRIARPDLRRAIEAAPPALTQASFVLADLDSNEAALDTLVRSTDRVVNAVHGADPGVGQLVSGAATTFDAIASQASALQATLTSAPPTLIAARATLAHADRTLTAAGELARRLAPGVDQVRGIASPLNSVLGTVVQVGPDAVSTLATVRHSAPDVSSLLTTATPLMPKLTSIGRQAVPQLGCIRPYTPDVVAFITNWGDWLSATDGRDRYGRANVQAIVPAPYNAVTASPATIVKDFPGLTYGFPYPPGYNAGQPWFLPQCGAGPDALNPAKDPEARARG
jgi:ABC-type transporter Mla subunit MlaD